MMCDIADVRKRYESVCIIEDNKDRIIKDLVAISENLTEKLRDKRDEIDNNKRLIALLKEDLRNHENMRRDQAKLSFVSVLVDGDVSWKSRQRWEAWRLGSCTAPDPGCPRPYSQS